MAARSFFGDPTVANVCSGWFGRGIWTHCEPNLKREVCRRIADNRVTAEADVWRPLIIKVNEFELGQTRTLIPSLLSITGSPWAR